MITKQDEERLYLNDKQYSILLKKILAIVRAGTPLYVDDDETPGCKSTTSSCGFCNDDLTVRETALFPSQYPARKSMKYRKQHQICPFDWRIDNVISGTPCNMFNGCFYTCRVAHARHKIPKETAMEWVNQVIALNETGTLEDKVKKLDEAYLRGDVKK